MAKATLIRKGEARVVDLGAKKILKYTPADKQLEVNHMFVEGRHPEAPDQYIYETGLAFMLFVLKGEGKIYYDDEVFEVLPDDVVYVPRATRIAAEGEGFEYLTFEAPAWYPEQAFIVDKAGKIVEETRV